MLLEKNLELLRRRNYGFNDSFCQAYTKVTYEIEYDAQGFIEGDGTLITVNSVFSGSNYSCNLPLSALEYELTYEFSICSIVNENSVGEWNSSHCSNTTTRRLDFTAP